MPDARTYTQAELDAAVQAEAENHRRPQIIIARELRRLSRELNGIVHTLEQEWRKAPADMPTMDERRATAPDDGTASDFSRQQTSRG